MCSNLCPRWVIRLSRSLKSKVESKFARTDSLSLGLPRKRTIKPSGGSLDTHDPPTLIKRRCHRAVPLSLLSVGKDGKPTIDNSLILDTRERFIPLDTTKAYKLNAGTTGVCMCNSVWSPCHFCVLPARTDRVLYGPDTTAKIFAEAAKPDSILSLNDRIGLVLDSAALAKAGYSDTGSMFTRIDGLREEKECTHSDSGGARLSGTECGK